MFNKSLIQFSVNGQGCVPSLLLDLGPNYGGGNEDNGDLLHKVPACTAALMPPNLQQATADPRLHRRLVDTHRQVWVSPLGGSLLLSPGSWCTQGFVCGLQESDSSVLCKFWWFYGGDNGDLPRAYAIPRFATPRAPAAGHCSPAPPQETLRHVSGSVSVGWACVLCCSQV